MQIFNVNTNVEYLNIVPFRIGELTCFKIQGYSILRQEETLKI